MLSGRASPHQPYPQKSMHKDLYCTHRLENCREHGQFACLPYCLPACIAFFSSLFAFMLIMVMIKYIHGSSEDDDDGDDDEVFLHSPALSPVDRFMSLCLRRA